MILRYESILITGIIALQRLILNATCWFFFGHRDDSVNTILIYRTSALGDFLFAVPAMSILRRRFPNARITLLTTTTTQSATKAIVDTYVGNSPYLPWLDFVVPSLVDDAICFNSLNPSYLYQSVRPKIRGLNPDLVFILTHPGDPFSGIFKKLVLLRFLGVSCRVHGWRMRSTTQYLRESQYRAGLFEHKVMGPLRSLESCKRMPRVEEMDVSFPLSLPSDAVDWAAELWRQNGWDREVVVAVAPGSIQPHKRWPEEKFVELCRRLVELWKVKLVVIGTASDQLLGNRIGEVSPSGVVNLAGVSTVAQSAAALAQCALLVGNDGGAMHLGAAVGCMTVSIVPGIEYPGSIEPWGNAELAVRHDVDCAPCYSFTFCPQQHNKCMVDLTIDSVLSRCALVLNAGLDSNT